METISFIQQIEISSKSITRKLLKNTDYI